MHLIFATMSIVITLAALLGYLNSRYLKLPTTIAINAGSILITLGLIILGSLGFSSLESTATKLISTLSFRDLLLDGMLSLLLFAGAFTIKIHLLRQCKWEILTLAFGATIASTFIVGFSIFYLLQFLNIHIPLIFALLFGALISPTDPIAVLAIFKEINAPKKLEVTVAGESLFNDGVGIVLFLTLFELAFSGKNITWQGVSLLFLQQAIGGIVYGWVLAWFGCRLLKSVNDIKVVILITLAMTTGGYFLTFVLNVSGPLAMVVAGIVLGNHPELFTPRHRQELDMFWELVDEVLNAILFLLIGLELLVRRPHSDYFIAAALSIPLVLFARFITVGSIMAGFKLKRTYDHHFIKILTWGGLRGGLAIALALTLPDNPYNNLILTMTYAVVIFSIIVQGLTIEPMARVSKQKSKEID